MTETSTGSAATAAVGTDPIVPSAATFSAGLSSNYTIAYANGTLTVNPAALTITANNANKSYGQTATFARPRSPTPGLVNGDTISGVTETSAGSGPTAASEPTRSCPAPRRSRRAEQQLHDRLRQRDADGQPRRALDHGEQREQDLRPDDNVHRDRVHNPRPGNGDTISGVTETSTGSAATAAAGTDPIVPSAATFSAGLSSNYAITYANGTLTVNPAALPITANNATKTYGQTATFAATAFTPVACSTATRSAA